MPSNEYARLGRIKYVTFSTWLAEREADIAQTYQDVSLNATRYR